jgi:hypothetical protein
MASRLSFKFIQDINGMDNLVIDMDNSIRRRFITVLLRSIEDDSVDIDGFRESFRITGEAFNGILLELERDGLLSLIGDVINVDRDQRIRLAHLAFTLGADFERVSRHLGWLEFEELTSWIFEENGFRTHNRFRFTAEGRRWEIDVLAIRSPYILCVECKHWQRGLGNSTMRNIIEEHIEKVRILSENLKEFTGILRMKGWDEANLLPMTAILAPTRLNIYRRVPAVSVTALPTFISEFEGQMGRLTSFKAILPKERPKPRQTILRP